jgi:hypothetical protein
VDALAAAPSAAPSGSAAVPPPAAAREPAAAGASHPDGNGDGKTANAAAPAAARKDPRLAQAERRFIAKLLEQPGRNASEADRLAWEQSPVADLLYPPDHACAGQPLDSTSPAVLTAAAEEALDKQLANIDNAKVPQCLYQGNWPFQPLNQACSGVDEDNPDSVARCTDFLMTAPQDPQAYPATIWLPCTPNGGQPTTLQAFYEGMVAEQVQQMFSGPPCTVH